MSTTTRSTRTSIANRATQAMDGLVGDRLRTEVADRVRAEVGDRLGHHEQQILDTLEGPLVGKILADEVARQVEAEVARQLSSPQPELTEDERKTAWLRSKGDFTSDLYFGSGLRYDRTITRASFNRVSQEIRTLTGVGPVAWLLQQAFRLALDHETRGLGRIAGSTYNVIGKLVTPPLLRPPPGPVLEIGTLYGQFSPALIQQFRNIGEFRQLTVVDPFEGTQIQPGTAGGTDPTGTPVTSQVARHNLTTLGVRPEDLQVIEGYSTDPAVREQVAQQHYAVIIVDGDHSEDGVYQDLWWVQDVAVPGAIVVMDDFGDPQWKGVERAARRYLADGGRLELLGTVSTSAYLTMPTAETTGETAAL